MIPQATSAQHRQVCVDLGSLRRARRCKRPAALILQQLQAQDGLISGGHRGTKRSQARHFAQHALMQSLIEKAQLLVATTIVFAHRMCRSIKFQISKQGIVNPPTK
jgi:hypothetical protein